MNYSYTTLVPIAQWFFYQAWLAQRGQFPASHYLVYPVDLLSLELAFTTQSARDTFVQHWAHTLTNQ